MTDTIDWTTVMSSADTSSHNTASWAQPPKFITNKTPHTRYRNALRILIKILNNFARLDTRAKLIRNGAGHLTYQACDDVAQDLLQQAEQSNLLNMGGKDDDDRTKFIKNIISIIAELRIRLQNEYGAK